MAALTAQQLDELDSLHVEAVEARDLLVQDAIQRVSRTLSVGLRPVADDVRLVQQFMGQRTAQNRYGQ